MGKRGVSSGRELRAQRAAQGAPSAASREGAAAAAALGSKRFGMESGAAAAGPVPGRFPFPYTPYRIQEQFMEALYGALEAGRVGIFESPTGTVRRRGRAAANSGRAGPRRWRRRCSPCRLSVTGKIAEPHLRGSVVAPGLGGEAAAGGGAAAGARGRRAGRAEPAAGAAGQRGHGRAAGLGRGLRAEEGGAGHGGQAEGGDALVCRGWVK